MKLLITGACGHIGSYIIDNIHKIKKIKQVYLIDNFNIVEDYNRQVIESREFIKSELSNLKINSLKIN